MAKLHFGKWTLGSLALALAAGAAPMPVAPARVPAPPVPAGAGAGPAGRGAPVARGGAVAAPVQAVEIKPADASTPFGGSDRFLSYIATDKPIYRANEKVYVRAVLLNAATHMPLKDEEVANAQVQILGPKGETVASGGAQSENSIVAFGWTVPESASGGEYTFKLTYPFQGYTPAERKFDVRIYRAPRLRNQVNFAREGYGPGDTVTATVHSERAEGGFPANAKVTVIARVDNVQVYTGPASIDAKGDCTATFALPKAMERGDGTLAFAIEDGGTVETAAKTIPILLQTLDLNMYAEGGDPVAGVNNRFYVEAKTPNAKPADLVGAIVDSKGRQVAAVKTEHEGRGRFDFVPAAGETYTLKLSEPAGITKTWNLPAASAHGVAIQAVGNIVEKNKPVQIKLAATEAGLYKVTLRKREVDVSDPVSVVMRAGMNAFNASVAFDLKPEVDGVLTATVWNEKGEPLAERLVYRQPAHAINVQVRADQSQYTPGGKAKLDIYTTDEAGKAISALVGLTVSDDTVQQLIEKREQAPRLPVMVMLEGEVRELADAEIYLDAGNPKAPLATDLLLGTQGWRRFATVKPQDFLAKYGDNGRRVLAFKTEPVVARFGGGFGGGGAAGRGGRGGAVRAMALGGAAMPEMAEANMAVDDLAVKEGALQINGGKLEQEKFKDAVPPAAAPRPAAAANKVAGPAVAAEMPMAPGLAADRQQAQPAAGAMRIRGGGGGAGGFAPAQMGPGAMLVVREYAHELRPNWSPTDRSDFTETLYWNA
ncbi:MAG TPA: MG2 domain-containing protein, partial [Phycisphaerae bacterium]|nr:MG2 domain-containing protein [Phycisphaerae bacterium]